MRILAVTVSLLVLAPAGDALSTVITFTASPPSFDKMHVVSDGLVGGSDAQLVRSSADSGTNPLTGQRLCGNADGYANATEIDCITPFAQIKVQSTYGSKYKSRNLTLDDAPPTDVKLRELEFHNAEGPADSQAPVGVHSEWDVSFLPGHGTKHTLYRHRTSTLDNSANFTLTAPSGNVIESIRGLPNVEMRDHNRTVYLPDTQGNRDAQEATVVFAPDPGTTTGTGTAKKTTTTKKKTSAAPEMVALLALVVALALVERRTRRSR